VAEQRRAERGVEVDVRTALAVREAGPLGRGDHEVFEPRDAALTAVDAAWDHGPRTLGQRRCPLRCLRHSGDYNDPSVVRQQII
jgi:hypothetical protein